MNPPRMPDTNRSATERLQTLSAQKATHWSGNIMMKYRRFARSAEISPMRTVSGVRLTSGGRSRTKRNQMPKSPSCTKAGRRAPRFWAYLKRK